MPYKIGKWLFFLSGWLVSIALGVLDLPAKVVSFAENTPKAKEVIWDYSRYEGRYSSDPDAWVEAGGLISEYPEPEEQLDVGEIQLSIAHDGEGKYSGEIHSMTMAEEYFAPWSRVFISGEVGLSGSLKGEVWDVVQGEKAVYSRFVISPDDAEKGTLRLVPMRAEDGVFPGDVILWPTDRTMADGVRGKRFQEALKRVVEQGRSPLTEE